MFDHEKTKGKHKGKHGYGWSNMLCRWCTAALKQVPLKKHMDNRAYNKFKGKGVDYYEQKIIQELHNKQMSLFEELGKEPAAAADGLIKGKTSDWSALIS